MSRNLQINEIQNLYKLRNNMIDVKQNFKSSNVNNMWCKICHLFSESQQHLLVCQPLRMSLRGLVDFDSLKYDMIFGPLKEQEKFAKN